MSTTGATGTKRRPDRSGWKPPPYVSSPALEIDIDKDACTGCDLCVIACPTDCLELDTEVQVAYVVRLDACIICYSCEEVCKPDCLHVHLDTQGRES